MTSERAESISLEATDEEQRELDMHRHMMSAARQKLDAKRQEIADRIGGELGYEVGMKVTFQNTKCLVTRFEFDRPAMGPRGPIQGFRVEVKYFMPIDNYGKSLRFWLPLSSLNSGARHSGWSIGWDE